MAIFSAVSKLPEMAMLTSTNCPAETDTAVVEEQLVVEPLIEQLIDVLLSVKLLPSRSVNVSVTPVPGAASVAIIILVMEQAVGTMDITEPVSVVDRTVGLVTLKNS